MNLNKIKKNIELEEMPKIELLKLLEKLYMIQKKYQDDILSFSKFDNIKHTKITKEQTVKYIYNYLNHTIPELNQEFIQKLKEDKICFYTPNSLQVPEELREESLSACIFLNGSYKVYIPLTQTILDGSNLIHELMHLINAYGRNDEFNYINECIPFLMDMLYQDYMQQQKIGSKLELLLLQYENDYNNYTLNQLLIDDCAYLDQDATISFISHMIALLLNSFLIKSKLKEEIYKNILEWNQDSSYMYVYEFMEELGLSMEERNGVLVFTQESIEQLLQYYQCYLEEKHQKIKL